MQKNNFPFEILIHDDASTDGTQEILAEYQERYPEIIFPLFQKENQYSQGVRGIMARFNFPRAKGKYIALCEGDDFWIDEHKLQNQIDFLDAHEDFSICFHDVEVLKSNGERITDKHTSVPNNCEHINTLAECGNYIHTPTVVVRNCIHSFPDELYLSPIGDYFIYMMYATKGKIGYMPKTMAVYRESVGVWSGQSTYQKHFKTSICYALLHKYFIGIERAQLSNIFLNRIAKFIGDFASQTNTADIKKLLLTDQVEEKILATMLMKIEHLQKQSIKQEPLNMVSKIIKRFKKYFSNNK